MTNWLRGLDKELFSRYPDPHNYETVSDRVLWALQIISIEMKIERVSAAQVANFLTEIVEINTSRQAVEYSLKTIKDLVNKNKEGYKIMQKGRERINPQEFGTTEIYISAGEPLTSKNILSKKILSQLKGEIRICDPHLGARTLDLLLAIDKKQKIRILTSKISEELNGATSRALSDIKKEGYDVEIKIYEKSELHDRYLMDEKNMWIIGHSLKDIGKKECYVIKVSPDMRETIIPVFDRRWNAGKLFS